MSSNYCATLLHVLFCFQIPEIRTVCVDLSDWAATRKAVGEIGPVDLLVNNAAIIRLSAFLETKEDELDKYVILAFMYVCMYLGISYYVCCCTVRSFVK